MTTSTSAPAGAPPSVRVTIGAASGRYAGEPNSVSTTIKLIDVTQPERVILDGRQLKAGSGPGPRWIYDASTATLTVDLGSWPVDRKGNVDAVGASPLTGQLGS